MTYTPDDLLAAAAREADIYGQTRIPAMLRAGAEAMRECERLRMALTRIAHWNLPPSGMYYPNTDGTDSDRPAPYDSFYAFGSEGGKKAIRDIARAALQEKPHG